MKSILKKSLSNLMAIFALLPVTLTSGVVESMQIFIVGGEARGRESGKAPLFSALSGGFIFEERPSFFDMNGYRIEQTFLPLPFLSTIVLNEGRLFKPRTGSSGLSYSIFRLENERDLFKLYDTNGDAFGEEFLPGDLAKANLVIICCNPLADEKYFEKYLRLVRGVHPNMDIVTVVNERKCCGDKRGRDWNAVKELSLSFGLSCFEVNTDLKSDLPESGIPALRNFLFKKAIDASPGIPLEHIFSVDA
jgi:hypothetical protein